MAIDFSEIERADVVIGVDLKSGRETVFYGSSLLRLIAEGLENPDLNYRVCRVRIDFDSVDYGKLAAACLLCKGSHDLKETRGHDDDATVV